MFWFVVIAALLVLSLVVRRVSRGRRSPDFDQRNLENANYARLNQAVANMDHRYGDHS